MNQSKLALTEADRTRLFAAIGHIVVRFQQIELWVAEILADLLGLNPLDDRYSVMAAMSYRQKVDLLVALFPKKAKNHFDFEADIELARRALYVAEEFRNRVVHSVWSVSEEENSWIREKGNLRSKAGFAKQSVCVDIDMLESAAESLRVITEWYLTPAPNLEAAITQLKRCESFT
ncbi:MAG: hypothetical protein O9318_06405 [Hylemonella sp.]|uniref:hypothetical protein n=1 Tax=Hylemonella sp. TaxID=2066020 RepID=UPI0022BEDC69|nr:hypothetical protein [Hylemonella sp.]MCZ8252081.1 hypothetical protein [Hylemonella sp.]